jgi:hypothetical protein
MLRPLGYMPSKRYWAIDTTNSMPNAISLKAPNLQLKSVSESNIVKKNLFPMDTGNKPKKKVKIYRRRFP